MGTFTECGCVLDSCACQINWERSSGQFNIMWHSGFELVKQNQFTKNSEHSEEIGPMQTKIFLDLRIILWKMERVLTNFWKLIWTIMYYESLWNHVVIHQVFNRLKITYYIASSMNNAENSWSIWFKRFTNFRKNAKTHSQTAKTLRKFRIANG